MKAFKNQKSTYRIEVPFIGNLGGDFVFRHVATDQRLLVELKRNSILKLKGKLLHTSSYRGVPVIPATSHFDLLFTTGIPNTTTSSAFLIPMKDLPEDWFVQWCLDKTIHHVPFELEKMSQFQVPLQPDSELVSRCENILDRLRSQRTSERGKPWQESLTRHVEDFEARCRTRPGKLLEPSVDVSELPEKPAPTNPDAGNSVPKTRWLRTTWEARQEYILLQYCRQR